MDIHWVYVLAGLLVGFVVGVTGIGGGSLMTPILLYFGVSPASAVGTDLLYAAVTKTGGVYVHHKKGNVDWSITFLLALGSVPAAGLTLWLLSGLKLQSNLIDDLIRTTLGFALIITALVILFKQSIVNFRNKQAQVSAEPSSRHRSITVCVGIGLGVVVTLTSIGAGALGTVALFLLFPLLSTVRLVGTEIAHAVPLTLIAGLGHAGLGHVDWELLLNLLIRSLPGIYVGSHLAHRLADKYMRPALAIMLIFVGGSLV